MLQAFLLISDSGSSSQHDWVLRHITPATALVLRLRSPLCVDAFAGPSFETTRAHSNPAGLYLNLSNYFAKILFPSKFAF